MGAGQHVRGQGLASKGFKETSFMKFYGAGRLGRVTWGQMGEGNKTKGANLTNGPGAGSAQGRGSGGAGAWEISLGTSFCRLQLKILATLASSLQNSLLGIGIGQEAKAKKNWLELGLYP